MTAFNTSNLTQTTIVATVVGNTLTNIHNTVRLHSNNCMDNPNASHDSDVPTQLSGKRCILGTTTIQHVNISALSTVGRKHSKQSVIHRLTLLDTTSSRCDNNSATINITSFSSHQLINTVKSIKDLRRRHERARVLQRLAHVHGSHTHGPESQ